MTMGNRHEYQALDWVNTELRETLKQAQLAIAAFDEDRSDVTRLQFCLNYLHQVRGTLEMVEVFGAALLARELERLTEFLNRDPERADDAALSILLQGILQLPVYLERVQYGGHDHPAIIAPLIDEIRARRDAPAIDEAMLFAPRLLAEYPRLMRPLPSGGLDQEIRQRLRRLRQLYQFALLGILRGDNIDDNLQYISKASGRLARQLDNSGPGEFWHIVSAVMVAARDGLLPEDTDLRPLLMRIERQLGQQIQATDKGQTPSTDLPLLQHLLYFVARARPETDALKALHARFNLHSLDADQAMIAEGRENLKGPDQDTIKRVSAALIDDLSEIKERLDLFVRSDSAQASDLADFIAPLRQISGTLPMLRLNQAKQVLDDQILTLERLTGSDDIDNKDIMDVAGALLYVESTLSGTATDYGDYGDNGASRNTSDRHAISTAQQALIREVRNALESCKDAIVAFIGAQWSRDQLTDVPHWLQQVEANLSIIPLPEPAQIINTLRQYVQRELLNDANRDPEWSEMDQVAEALVAVDYYLERLSHRGHGQADEDIIARARASLAALGYKVTELPDSMPTAESALAATVEDYFETDLHSSADNSVSSATTTAHSADDAVYDLDDDDLELDDSREFKSTNTFTFNRSKTEGLSSPEAEDDAAEESAAPPAIEDDLSDLEFTDLDLELDDEPDYFTDSDLEAGDRDDGDTLATDSASSDNVSESTKDTGSEETSATKPSADEETQTAPDTRQADADDEDDLIDDDIREIFLEEADEVLAELHQWFPHYQADWDHATARTEIRRAFHTLKGSGRMVRALVVGELAWSVENMLNRVLEGSIVTTEPMIELISDVIAAVPELVADFGQGRQSDTAKVDALRDRADALSRGEMPPAALEEPNGPQADATADGAMDETPDEAEDSAPDERQAKIHSADSADPPDPADTRNTDAARLRSIFQQEIDSHLQTLQAFVDAHGQEEHPVLDDRVQRALHTIKGSADMAGITVVANMAGPLEDIAKDIQSFSLDTPGQFPPLLAEMVTLAKQQLAQVQAGETPTAAPKRFFKDIDALRRHLDDGPARGGDDSLMSIFLNEAMNTVLGAEDTLREWQQTGVENRSLKHLQRDLITLADAARAIELLPLSALANQLILLYEHLQIEPPKDAEHPAFKVLYRAHDAIIDMMDRLAAGQSVQNQPHLEAELAKLAGVPVAGPAELSMNGDQLTAAGEAPQTADTVDDGTESDDDASGATATDPEPVQEQKQQPVPTAAATTQPADNTPFVLEDTDPELLDIFLEEANELLESIANELEQWQSAPADLTPVSALQRDLHTLKGGARMAEATPVGDLAHELEFIYEALSQGQLTTTADLLSEVQPAQDYLAQMVQDLTERQQCQNADHLIQHLHALRLGKPSPNAPVPQATAAPALEEPEETALDVVAKGDIRFTRAELDSLDGDILEVFVDEAVELIRDLDDAIYQWREKPSNELIADEMKRVLHTLKGGARLARLPSLGTLSHDLETFVVRAQQTHTPLDHRFFAQILTQYDQLSNAIEQLQHLMADNDDPADDSAASLPAPTASSDDAPASSPAPAKARDNAQALRRNTPQETVKVNANLLENLVNLAGESSIARARLEEQVNDLGFTLGDLDTTIERLRDRVRQLDQETEAQVLFRQERAEESNYEDFDPLEMDRYSQIQQLSRSLMETSSDLLDLRTTLTNKSRDAETVLLQQSRIHTDLQEGLMQTRMVPFSRLVPRLRRIVRQVSNELDKTVEFSIRNAEGELDRSVLERMISPLEHMLRNAVDHGLEAAEERLQNGKSDTGQITLDLRREGGDVVLTLQDDGRGIDVASVRQKAVANGLMQNEADLPDHDVLQFILTSGFSTARKVTQISGRGVGMDVVHSEVKALGGSMEIDTTTGQGTTFVVRLPFTVSVNRALMVGAGDDMYAIPLNTIDGVARVQPTDLAAYLTDEEIPFQYNGLDYQVQSLSQLIGSETELHVDELDMPQPVILVKTLERQQPLALHVDRLMGSREVVVKTLGPQFASVPSVNGATILGDGSVVIILDLPALLRRNVNVQLGQAETPVLPDAAEPATPRRKAGDSYEVMVIDDSVTVRKVTTRLLERNGMRVLTAKDGMDAMTLLQDHDPDILLLDIEMPRMDGFEVANRVRHTERLKHIPIIMITSRTGQKHKDRAAEIGVNDYMGKPFQEAPLLEAIERLLVEHNEHN